MVHENISVIGVYVIASPCFLNYILIDGGLIELTWLHKSCSQPQNLHFPWLWFIWSGWQFYGLHTFLNLGMIVID